MREEIAYQEMKDETGREAGDQEAGGATTPESAPAGRDGAGSPDPTRKEHAYPDLPGEGKPR